MNARLSKRTRFVSQVMVMADGQSFAASTVDISLTGLISEHKSPSSNRSHCLNIFERTKCIEIINRKSGRLCC